MLTGGNSAGLSSRRLALVGHRASVIRKMSETVDIDGRIGVIIERSLHLFAEFARSHGSVKPGTRGAVVSRTAIGDYVSAIRAFRPREAGDDLLVNGGNLRLPLQMSRMLREDGPAGKRGLFSGCQLICSGACARGC